MNLREALEFLREESARLIANIESCSGVIASSEEDVKDCRKTIESYSRSVVAVTARYEKIKSTLRRLQALAVEQSRLEQILNTLPLDVEKL